MIYEVSIMGKKEILHNTFSFFGHLTLMDMIFTVVTLFLKSLKLVRDLKLHGEEQLFLYVCIPICIFRAQKILWLKEKGKSSTEQLSFK